MLQPKDRLEYNRNKEERSAPIYEVIADFPGNNDFPVGKTITLTSWRASTIYWAYHVKDCQGPREYIREFFDKYPHLFKRIKHHEVKKEGKTKTECLWEYGINHLDIKEEFNDALFAAMELYADERMPHNSLVDAVYEGAGRWRAEYEDCRAILRELHELKLVKDAHGKTEEYQRRKEEAWKKAASFLEKYQHD